MPKFELTIKVVKKNVEIVTEHALVEVEAPSEQEAIDRVNDYCDNVAESDWPDWMPGEDDWDETDCDILSSEDVSGPNVAYVAADEEGTDA